MMRLTTVILLGACWGSSPRREPAEKPASPLGNPVTAVCPRSLENTMPWRRELFPGCPPPPFWWTGTLCEGACPRPCAARYVSRDRARPHAAHFIYDAQGRLELVREGRDARRASATTTYKPRPSAGDRYCTREPDGRGSCRSDRREPHAPPEAIVRYDERGNVIAFQEAGSRGGVEFTYDAAGRLATETIDASPGRPIVLTYRYDAAGRVARIIQSGWGFNYTTTHTYDDATGLLLKRIERNVGADDQPGKPYERSTMTTTFEYDAQRRPVRISLVHDQYGVSPARDEQTYEYDCPAPRPFDEALAAAEQIKVRACGCADAACSAQVATELADWREGLTGPTYADPSASQGRAFVALMDGIRACIERASTGPGHP